MTKGDQKLYQNTKAMWGVRRNMAMLMVRVRKKGKDKEKGSSKTK